MALAYNISIYFMIGAVLSLGTWVVFLVRKADRACQAAEAESSES